MYKDDCGDIIDPKQFYICRECGWIGTVKEMSHDSDCSDMYDAVFSEYCCPNPKCAKFYLHISDWDKVDWQNLI